MEVLNSIICPVKKTFLKFGNGMILTRTRWIMNARTKAREIGIAIVCMATPKGPKQSGRTPVTPNEPFKRVVNGSRDPRKTPIPAFRTTIPDDLDRTFENVAA
jgi:hypothetical protein